MELVDHTLHLVGAAAVDENLTGHLPEDAHDCRREGLDRVRGERSSSVKAQKERRVMARNRLMRS